MNAVDEATRFSCGDDTLYGVLSMPRQPLATAVLVIVGGPQYRPGSHRQFVLLARRLAQHGYPVLRFDHRGIGDSSGAQRGFEDLSDDIAAAIGALQARLPALQRIVLWGLCDGASAALLYCHDRRDARVHGLCLLNPWLRSEASLAQTRVKHYYRERLLQRAFWRKLLRGQVAAAALGGLARNLWVAARARHAAAAPAAVPSYQQRMAAAWRAFGGSILLVLSGRDYTAREFSEHAAGDAGWAAAMRQVPALVHHLPQADHTFSGAEASAEVELLTLGWLNGLGAAPARRATVVTSA